MDVSAFGIIGVVQVEEIPGCDGYPCSSIDSAGRQNKTQEEIDR
jgi:hypothetical protein